jgi:hypothetical protein
MPAPELLLTHIQIAVASQVSPQKSIQMCDLERTILTIYYFAQVFLMWTGGWEKSINAQAAIL